jgi:hypothetical protein
MPESQVAEERVCAALFATGKVIARPIAPVVGPDGCRIAAPIEVSAVIVGPGRRIGLEPPVAIGCGIAGPFADWLRDDLVPLFDKATLRLVALSGTSGYACRPRNHVAGAKLSEHGLGDAIDIAAFVPEGGAPLGVKDPHAALLAQVKSTACARFATVLGPGADGFHESHLHVDLATRRNGSKICHWDLP